MIIYFYFIVYSNKYIIQKNIYIYIFFEIMPTKKGRVTRRKYVIKEGDLFQMIVITKTYYDKKGNKIRVESEIIEK